MPSLSRPFLLRSVSLALLALILPAASAQAVPTLELAIDGLSNPARVTAPEGDDRLFVVELPGRIRVFDRDGTDRGVFLDWTDESSYGGERGLLGLAFDPQYAQNGRFFINYTDNSGDTRVTRLTVDPADADRALPESATPILFVNQTAGNHNGGNLDFGADGMLYVGLGDGGGAGDVPNNAQNPQLLLGKMLRLDVSGGGQGYRVPADNPFVDDPEIRDEIWAIGLRNPWCYSFDRLTGDLYIADVGQGEWEEVDVQPVDSPGGENYGWRLMEGFECYNPPDCDQTGLTLPVHVYSHSSPEFGCSISGGFVYRGDSVPALYGRYLFADYCSDDIWSLRWTSQGGLIDVVEHTAELTPPGGWGNIVSISEDGIGDLYIVDKDGEVWRIVEDDTSDASTPAVTSAMVGAHPNPFNPRTELVFTLDRAAEATITVHDLSGRRIATVAAGSFAAGETRVPWDAVDGQGRPLASGVYLARLETGEVVSSIKITLAR
jgi:glucose/arabinose dehydrogenase